MKTVSVDFAPPSRCCAHHRPAMPNKRARSNWTPREACGEQEMVEVPIPTGVNTGAVIGRNGANCKELGLRFGCYVRVDAERRVVQCVGGGCHGAAEAVRKQMEAAPHTVVYPHPQAVLTVLHAASAYQFARLPSSLVPLLNRRGRQQPLYVLAPAHSTCTDSASADEGLQVEQGTSSYTGPNTTLLLQPAATSQVCMHVSATISQARSVQPAPDEIQLRYVIGKQTYYESRTPGSHLALSRTYTADQVQGMDFTGSGPLKARFCPELNASAVARVEQKATDLGFRVLEEERRITVNLEDYGSSDGALKGVAVNLRVQGGVCSVRKVSSATNKPLFASFINPDPDKLDFRLQVMTMYHNKPTFEQGSQAEGNGGEDRGDEDAAEAWRFAEGCRWDMSTQKLILPDCKRYRVEAVRTKVTRVFAGTCSGHDLRLASSMIEVNGGWYHALGGYSPGIQDALESSGSGAAGTTLLPSGALQAMVQLCEELASV